MKWIVLLGISLLFPSRFAHSQDDWLQPPSLQDWGGEFKRVPATNYLQLGADPQALQQLESQKFVLDRSTSGHSLDLRCDPPSKRYLIRSLYIANATPAVFTGPKGLIVDIGSFSEPSTPGRSAMAICLPADPSDVRAGVSFAK